MSGPQTIASLSTTARRQLSLNVSTDLSSVLAGEPTSALAVSEHAVLDSASALTSALPFMGSTYFFTSPRLVFNSLEAAAEGVCQIEPLVLLGFELDEPITLVGPWALL